MRAGARTACAGCRSQFRGMGLPEHELTVTGTVHELRDGVAVVHTVAEQDGKAIIRNAEAEIAVE